MSYRWHPDERPPPQIEAHSKAKLSVLRSYLRANFYRLNVYPGQEVFRLDLIDGFAGGGLFLDGKDPLPGTPLIVLEEASDAEVRLNRGRSKRLHFDCKHYLVEKDANHAAHLHNTLKERGFSVDGNGIVLRNAAFENEIDDILASIHNRQPHAGRSLFLLDQNGYSRVALYLIRRIFEKLEKVEVILTFAADALVRVKIFYGANATIRAFPLSGSHITRFSMCAFGFPNRISTGIGKIQATPTLRGANESSQTATYSPNPLLPLDLHYSIRNVHPLVNFLKPCPEMVQAVAPLNLTKSDLHNLYELRNEVGGRSLVQRALREHIRSRVGAHFDTPFFIRPKNSRRALWLLHLSRHPAARDVMIRLHWALQNTFEHYGPGSFGMLGWNAARRRKTIPLL